MKSYFETTDLLIEFSKFICILDNKIYLIDGSSINASDDDLALVRKEYKEWAHDK